ncbi:Serine/threonine-protein phosphatase 4 regulatory subunit 3 [Hondaea fermentalgiana]|uniref:Serine/threonine-protein phosphatase 4 regulatory subunit 3 n=1 Tax=Hondaea fermentalgiana TaxID=2315210 RepID=A0A2R5GYY7_9STRA|nr:Serine/threonine-protein phosphatase 4 regulatory subunit 3 [Hondaea fermentalgiana]|eukprot:GBG33681.1 Serine/threonine-protein phosphatase 4 regulatory subunit 3 [Hondaea fermentalgiana]
MRARGAQAQNGDASRTRTGRDEFDVEDVNDVDGSSRDEDGGRASSSSDDGMNNSNNNNKNSDNKTSTAAGSGSNNPADSMEDNSGNPAHGDETKRSWRVKVYRLDNESRWIDEGTGMVEIKYLRRINGNAIQVTADHENETPGQTILESAIVAEHIYQTQSKMIITWTEPTTNMELAISFEEQQGFEYILDQLCQIQGRVSADFHGVPRNAQGEYGGGIYRGGSGNSSAGGRDGEADSRESFAEHMERCELPDVEVDNLDRILDLLANMNPVHREAYLNAVQMPYRPKSKRSKKKRKRGTGASRKRPRARGTGTKTEAEDGSSGDLADGDLFLEEILSDEYFEDIVGVLEYDPEVKPKPEHREFLRKHVQHKVVVPIEDPETLRKIHQSFRIRFLRDAVMPRTMDEGTASIINDMDANNGMQIANALHSDPHYLHNIFALMRADDTPPETRNDAVGCLQELCSLAKKMQVPSRNAFYRSLMKKGENFFGIFERILGDPNSSVQERLNIGDILKLALDHDPTQLRSFILTEKTKPQSPRVRAYEVLNKLLDDVHTPIRVKLQRQMDLFAQPETPQNGERPPLSLMAQLLKRLVFDPEAGMQAQAMEILRMLLDPETMEAAEKESFLTLFYDHYIWWLVLPLEMLRVKRQKVRNTGTGKEADRAGSASPLQGAVGNRAPFSSASRGYELVMCSGLLDAHTTTMAQSPQERLLERKAAETARVAEHHITELLSFCVQTHGFRVKYFVLNQDIVDKVLRLLYSRDKHLVLGAIRFARTCVGLKDDFYNRHIVKLNLFAPIFEVFVSNGPRNNLINSAIIELLEFVRMEKIRLLIKYIVENFGDKLSGIDYVETYARLKETYDANNLDSTANISNVVGSGDGYVRLQHQRQGRPSLLGISEVASSSGGAGAVTNGDFRPFGEHGWQLSQDEDVYFNQRNDGDDEGLANANNNVRLANGTSSTDDEAAASSTFRRMQRGMDARKNAAAAAADAADAMEEDIEDDEDEDHDGGRGFGGINGGRKNKHAPPSTTTLDADANSKKARTG